MNSINTEITHSGYGYYWLTLQCNEGPRHDIVEWYKETFAENAVGHSYSGQKGDTRMTLAFVNKDDALLTKLRWA